jgi:hypothetical protein
MLWLYQRTMFGKVENPKNEGLRDLNLREFVTFAPLIVLALWIGIYPAPFLSRLTTSVEHVVARVNSVYGPRNAQMAIPGAKAAPDAPSANATPGAVATGQAAGGADCGSNATTAPPAGPNAAPGPSAFVAITPCGDGTQPKPPAPPAPKPRGGR